MPYGIRKSPNKELYWVFNKETGRKYSKSPIPKERAEAQRRAIYASENRQRFSRGKKSPKKTLKKASPKKSLKKVSPKKKRSPKKSLGEHLSQNDFFKKIKSLEKRGDTASMNLRQKMLENILK